MKRRSFFGFLLPALFGRDEWPVREVGIRRQPDGSFVVHWIEDGKWIASTYDSAANATNHAMRYLIEDLT